MSSFITWNSMFTWRATKECFWFITTASIRWQFNIIKCFRAFLNKYIFLSHYCYSPSSFFLLFLSMQIRSNSFPTYCDTKSSYSISLFLLEQMTRTQIKSFFSWCWISLYIWNNTVYNYILIYMYEFFFSLFFGYIKRCICVDVYRLEMELKMKINNHMWNNGWRDILLNVVCWSLLSFSHWIFYSNFCRYTDEWWWFVRRNKVRMDFFLR